MDKIKYKTSLLSAFISIFLLLIGIANLPYGYYTFLRLAIPFLSFLVIFGLYINDCIVPVIYIPVFLILILWNPILPIYLSKSIWIICDIIASIIFLFVIIYELFKSFARQK